MMKEEINIERLSPKNFDKFYKLFCDTFGHQHSYKALQKKYETSYLGSNISNISFLALNKNGDAISHSGVVPSLFNIKNKTYLGGQMGDHMTLPAYRGQKTLKKLNDKAEEHCKENNISFLFSFLQDSNKYYLKKYANWDLYYITKVFIINIRTVPFSNIINRFKIFQNLYQKYSSQKIQKYPSTTILRDDWIGVARNLNYANYKQTSKNQILQLANGTIWFKLKGNFILGDFKLNKDGDFNSLLVEIKSLAAYLGCRKILFITSPNTPQFQKMSSLYNSFDGSTLGGKILDDSIDINFNELQFTYIDFDSF